MHKMQPSTEVIRTEEIRIICWESGRRNVVPPQIKHFCSEIFSQSVAVLQESAYPTFNLTFVSSESNSSVRSPSKILFT